MSPESLNRAEAVDAFLKLLIPRAYDGAINGTLQTLEKGPSGRRPSTRLVNLHQWFQSLDDEGQRNVRDLIESAVDSALFGALVVLDGASGGYPIPGILSEFALYLQVYENDQSLESDNPQTRVRLNHGRDTDLHDEYHWAIKKQISSNNKQNKPS